MNAWRVIPWIAVLTACAPERASVSPVPPPTTAEPSAAPASAPTEAPGAPLPPPPPPPRASATAAASAAPPGGEPATRPSGEGDASNAASVVMRARGKLKSCHQRAIAADPSVGGTVVFEAVVGADGKVQSVRIASNTGLPQSCVACLEHVLRGLQFDPPEHPPQTYRLPMAFPKNE